MDISKGLINKIQISQTNKGFIIPMKLKYPAPPIKPNQLDEINETHNSARDKESQKSKDSMMF